jgi:hypothetical protein
VKLIHSSDKEKSLATISGISGSEENRDLYSQIATDFHGYHSRDSAAAGAKPKIMPAGSATASREHYIQQ